MSTLETVTAVAAYRDRCEDRAAVFEFEERTVVVVSDGAGGVGSGEVAAEAVLREIELAAPQIHSANQWAATLRQTDFRIAIGEAAAVVVDVRPYGIAGASVGDSEAWIFKNGAIVDLTANQQRKPLLGTGDAVPIPFTCPPLDGLLLVATDGFCNYVNRDRLPPLIASSEFCTVPRRCIELARLPSGDLWDDIAIVAARVAPPRRTRHRYSI